MYVASDPRPLVEQLRDTKQFPSPLPVLSSYSGFVPNQVFDECEPVETLVFAAIQYLSFFSIKCSTSNIGKNLNASIGTIRNALNSLSKRRFIVKQVDGTYLFEKSSLGAPIEFVDAKKLSSSLGYWFPVELLKSKKISNQELRALSLIKSLTSNGSRKMDMEYIAAKAGLARVATSRIVSRLLSKKLISRDRPHHRSAYIYQTGGKEMSIYKQDLSTQKRNIIDQSNENDTPKGNQNDTPLSLNGSSNFYIDIGKEQRRSGTYKPAQKKSFFVLKQIVDYLIQEIEQIAEPKSKEEEIKSLNSQYTQACADADIDKIQELRAKIAVTDVEERKSGQIRNNTDKIKALLSDHHFCLKTNQQIILNDEQLKQIGLAVKAKVKQENYADSKKRNMALCLIFNSITLDVKAQHPKSLSGYNYQHKEREKFAMVDAIEICLARMIRDNYRINPELIPEEIKIKNISNKTAANENYSNRWDWLDQ